MAKFMEKGDKHTDETKDKLKKVMALHGGYAELRRWKAGKGPDLRTPFGKYIARVQENIIEDLVGYPEELN